MIALSMAGGENETQINSVLLGRKLDRMKRHNWAKAMGIPLYGKLVSKVPMTECNDILNTTIN